MNYADIKYCDVANGKGVRVSLFVSGCTHHCKGCFNEETWNFHYGKPFTEETEKQVLDYLDKSYIAGLSLLGGEPFEHVNQQGLLPLLRKVKARFPEKNIWCYTGYDFEKDILGRMAEQWAEPFIVDKLGDCFSRYDADDLLSALAATRELFLTLAKECASSYGYTTGIPEIDS